jgi:hypothetical protein
VPPLMPSVSLMKENLSFTPIQDSWNRHEKRTTMKVIAAVFQSLSHLAV